MVTSRHHPQVAIDAGLSNGQTIKQIHDVFQTILEEQSIPYKF